MHFYRGIAVAQAGANDVTRNIRLEGLRAGDGQWVMRAADLKAALSELWQRPTLSLADTRPRDSMPDWVCACAEREGALHYACSHNRGGENDTPILIEFEAPASDAVVDGRDFLYTIFQMGDPVMARPVIERIFGHAILEYADRAWSTNGPERIAICDLAVQDEAVIRAHAANNILIAGRYQTRFRSAFFVKLPITSDRIIDVRIVDGPYTACEAEVDLADVVSRPQKN